MKEFAAWIFKKIIQSFSNIFSRLFHSTRKISLKSLNESEIFSKLEILCSSPGYVHAIAFFCFRDNVVGYNKYLNVENILQQYSNERLVRSEISTLIGLACKGSLDFTLPAPEIIQKYIEETESLLYELHQSMIQPTIKNLEITNFTTNPFSTGSALRESIFYSGEAAYSFQYRDLSLEKYKNDDYWFANNKGYSIKQANEIVSAISRLQNKKINAILSKMAHVTPREWTSLPMFIFNIKEVADESKQDELTVKSFIDSFVSPESVNKNEFKSLGDFNPLNAYPIIQIKENEYLLFQSYSLMEALYETPFFWLLEDKQYKDVALKNRGLFTENFSKENLEKVFGKDRVFTNINIYNKKTNIGEIDVLVIFADRAIILQAKSKKLTIEARKGNDNSLRDDFKKAVQEAYDQAFLCANYLSDEKFDLLDSNGNKLNLTRKYKEIYPFCIVSEHYPSLSFQARQFLTYQTTDAIKPPFIMDVFFLDVLCEILQSPLYFLSYINRRVQYGDKILSNQEMTILSYHIKNNLWMNDETTMLIIDDDLGADLDLAMLVRRDNVPGKNTPEGILTKYKNTFFGKLIIQIERRDNFGIVDLGFVLLALSEETVEQLNDGVLKLIKLFRKDKKNHDFTLGINEASSGITIHCNNDPEVVAFENLKNHCLYRKNKEKAKSWFGICINPANSEVRFAVGFDY